ncbi:MAG TPA: TOBE domain-containing protein [Kofleriaceae bacterium]
MEISLRNQLKGRITEIVRSEVVSEVTVETAAGLISAVITTRSVDRLALKVGDDVHALIKATEVGIEKP